MRLFRAMFAAGAAVLMSFTAQAEKTAKAWCTADVKTLTFVYDDRADYGIKGTDWFSVSEAEELDPNDDMPWLWAGEHGVKTVVFDPSFAEYRPTHCGSWFSGFNDLTAVKGIENLNVSEASSLRYMFGWCRSLETVDLSSFDTSNVEDMSCMFFGCSALKTVFAREFDTDSLNPSGGNYMFDGCESLVGGKGTAYDSTRVDATYARLDGGSSAPGYFTAPPMTPKVLVENYGKTLRFVYDNVTPAGAKGTDWCLFRDDSSPELASWIPWSDFMNDVTLVIFDSSFASFRPESCSGWFNGFTELVGVLGLANLKTESVKSMSWMFNSCLSLTKLDISRLDTSKVTDMQSMFSGCSALTSLDLSGFDTAKVTDMSGMFNGCSALKTISVGDAFVTTAIVGSDDMFAYCEALVGGNGTVYDGTKTDKTCARIDAAGTPGYFTGKEKIAKAVLQDDYTTLRFVYDCVDYGIKGAEWYSVAEAEAIADPSVDDVQWYYDRGTVERVVFDKSFATYQPKSVANWFFDFNELTAVEGLAYLDTSKVTSFYCMFAECLALTSLDVSGFDTSNASDLSGMFAGCSSLSSLDVMRFRTSKVTEMTAMFAGCSALKTITASDAFVTTAVRDATDMFEGCEALKGGNGTVYDGAKTDKTYARIDKPGQAGYFTAGSAPGPNPGDDDPDGPGPKPIPTLFNSVMPAAVTLTKAATYNGFLGERSLGGTFTLSVKKPARGAASGKATLTKIDPTTGKKVKTVGTVNLATGRGEGDLAGLVLNAKGLGGTFAGFKVQGALDAGKAKDTATIDYLNTYNKTAYAFVLEDAAGERAMLTATFSKKGKVKIAGTVAGKKISGSAYMSVGDRCAVPFVYAKKSAQISFVLWFDKATRRLTDVSGFGDGVKVVACGLAETPALGAYKVTLAKADVIASVPDAIGATPLTVTTEFTGKKFDAGKAAKVAFRNGMLTIDTSRGDNVSGLALMYSRGSLSGSFTVYSIDPVRGRLVKNKFTVSGLVIDGVGYAVGMNKKLPSIPLKLK